MRVVILISSLLVLPSSLFAQHEFPDVNGFLNQTHTQRTLALSGFYELTLVNADSVDIFNYIEKVETKAKKHNDADLALEAEFMKAHYFVYRDYFSTNMVIQKIERLDKIAKEQGKVWLEIRTQSLLGNYLYYIKNNYGRGYEHLLRCVQLLEGKSPLEFPLKQICLHHVAVSNYSFKKYDDAITYYKLALEASSKYDRYYYKMHILNTLGLSYLQKENYDLADYYFKQALDNAEASNDKVWKAIIFENMATVLKKNEKYEEAIDLLEKAMSLSNHEGEAILSLIDIYILTKQIEQAKQSLLQLEAIDEETKSSSARCKYYLLKSKYLSYKSNGSLAGVYMDAALALKDSLNDVYNSEVILNAEQRLEYEKQKSVLKEKEAQQSIRLLFQNGLIVFLILLLIIGLLFYNRYKLKIKNREQYMLAEKQKAEVSLNQIKKSVQDKNEMISRFKEELKSVSNEVESLKNNTEQAISTEQKKKIIQLLQEAVILTDKDWREFSELFEKVNTGFLKRLKEKYPTLTKAEVRLMALSRLGLDNKEMAIMLGVGTAAIRQSKSRLRKKIDASQGVNLEDLAIEI